MTDTTATTPTGGYRATTTTVMRILAMATGTLVVVQFTLAGYGAFGVFQHHRGYGAHEMLGNIIGGVSVLVLIAALIARPSVRVMILAAVLVILALPGQLLLAAAGKDNAWIGGLHALAGIAILVLCWLLSPKIAPTT